MSRITVEDFGKLKDGRPVVKATAFNIQYAL